MKTLPIALVTLLLAACAAPATAPATVKVPVPVPCQAAVPARPVFPAEALTGDEDLWTIGKALWADLLAREAYERQLRTALEGCVAP